MVTVWVFVGRCTRSRFDNERSECVSTDVSVPAVCDSLSVAGEVVCPRLTKWCVPGEPADLSNLVVALPDRVLALSGPSEAIWTCVPSVCVCCPPVAGEMVCPRLTRWQSADVCVPAGRASLVVIGKWCVPA